MFSDSYNVRFNELKVSEVEVKVVLVNVGYNEFE